MAQEGSCDTDFHTDKYDSGVAPTCQLLAFVKPRHALGAYEVAREQQLA